MNRYGIVGMPSGGIAHEVNLIHAAEHLSARVRASNEKTVRYPLSSITRLLGVETTGGHLRIARELGRLELLLVRDPRQRAKTETPANIQIVPDWSRVVSSVCIADDAVIVAVTDEFFLISTYKTQSLFKKYFKNPFYNIQSEKLYNRLTNENSITMGYFEASIDDLRKLYDASHLASLSRFNTFNSRYLVPSITEIRNCTSMDLKVTQKTVGKKVVALNFYFQWEKFRELSAHELLEQQPLVDFTKPVTATTGLP